MTGLAGAGSSWRLILETIERGGNVIIPAFAVGRTQEVLYELYPPAEGSRLKDIKCFVDSPMAISTVDIYRRHRECFNAETRHLLELGFDPLSFPGVHYVSSREESRAINDLKEPHIIISASGMGTGGRVLHHLAHNLERSVCTVLLVGFQAEGTLGRLLQSGQKSVSLMGRQMDVRAGIELLSGFSAHADRSELLEWLRRFKDFPAQVFLNHGEPAAIGSLAEAIEHEFGSEVVIPKEGECYRLE